MDIPSDFGAFSLSFFPLLALYGAHLGFQTIVFPVGIVYAKEMSQKREMCQLSLNISFDPPPPHPEKGKKKKNLKQGTPRRRELLVKDVYYSYHFYKVLSVSDKNLPSWQVDRVEPCSAESNTTERPGLTGCNLPQAGGKWGKLKRHRRSVS